MAFGAELFAAVVFLALAGALVALAVLDLEAGFLMVSSFTPAAEAIAWSLALRREAVFFLRRCFLTALSYSDWAFARVSTVGLDLKALRAALMSFLIPLLCSVRLTACRAAFLADLIIGILFLFKLKINDF